MKGTLGLLGGCGGSSGGSSNESTLSKVEVVAEQDYVGMSSEASSYPLEAELELGLGLSLGGGGGLVAEKSKPCGWGERGRILTAKDFPSVVVVSDGNSSRFSSDRVSNNNNTSGVAVSGTKRTADSFSHEGGSPTGVRYDSWKFFFLYLYSRVCLLRK